MTFRLIFALIFCLPASPSYAAAGIPNPLSRIGCFVYDKPLLARLIQRQHRNRLQLLGVTFEPQYYAFALLIDSAIRRAVDLAQLNAVHSSWRDWNVAQYIGSR